MKKNLLVSFSGGETSAYMAQWLIKNKSEEYNMVFVFANTGQENEETLIFADQCDKAFGLNLVWVEALVVPEKGKGTGHKVVNYDTASRLGEPFEEVIKKYGIPNQAFPHCNRELKLNPIHHYIRHNLKWEDYYTAIGIRNDEIDRVNEKYKELKLYYPLVTDQPMSKPKINFWWANQPFRLNLKGYQGNCKWCWKKSTNKLLTLMKETPEVFDFPKQMEDKYKTEYNFFRQNRSVDDLVKLSKLPFKKPKDDSQVYDWQQSLFDEDLDVSNGCSESCEIL